MLEVNPSVGRIVHYVSLVNADGTQAYGSKCRAAVITEVGAWTTTGVQVDPVDLDEPTRRTVEQEWQPESCSLAVLNPTGAFFGDGGDHACPHDETERAGGTWHWPERV